MKKFFITLAAALSVVCASVSCTKEEEAPDSLTLKSTTILVPCAGSTQKLDFTANVAWTIASDAEWITLDKTGGEAGDASVGMTVALNDTYDNRTGKVTVTAGDKKTEFTVTQSGLSEFGSAVVYKIDASAQTIEIETKTNLEYTVEVAEESKGWITVLQAKAAPAEGVVKLQVEAKTELGPRTGYFSIVAPGYVQTYELVQNAEYTAMPSVKASYIKNTQNIYTEIYQYAVTLYDEENDGDYVVLALNTGKPEDITVIPEGEYTVDATAEVLPGTFSIKSTDGDEKYYTTVVKNGQEILVEDGAVNVAFEDGVYAITTQLVDGAGVDHRYSYEGAIEVADESFAAVAGSFESAGQYNTYFTTGTYEKHLTLYFSDVIEKELPFVYYAYFTLFTKDGGDKLVAGKYEYSVPEYNSELTYKNGTLMASDHTFQISLDDRWVDGYATYMNLKEGTTPELEITDNGDGTYNIALKASIVREYYSVDEDYNQTLIESGEFEISKVLENVAVGDAEANDYYTVVPDDDVVLVSGGNNPNYIGYYLVNKLNPELNIVQFGYTTVNGLHELYLSVNLPLDAWTFEKNFNNRYCSNPLPDGTYEFCKTADAPMTHSPVQGVIISRFVNGYTGTVYYINGGTFTLENGDITFNLTAKQSNGDRAVISITGGFASDVYYIRDNNKITPKLVPDSYL